MAGFTVTTQKVALRQIFNQASKIYYKSSEIKSTDLSGTSLTLDMELPVLGEGFTFNSGEAETTNIRLTDETIWAARVDKGDPDISIQVASFADKVNELFLNKVTAAAVVDASSLIDGKTFAGSGYSLSPKKAKGALFIVSQDEESIVVLPSVEMFGSLVLADGDNPAYFNVPITPLENSEGVEIFILQSTAPSL